MTDKKLILSLDEASMLEDPQDPGPWDGNSEDIPACTDWFLRKWAYENRPKPGETRSLLQFCVVSRINYGPEEPVHLPRSDYAWYPVRQAWLESDDALKLRREQALEEEQND